MMSYGAEIIRDLIAGQLPWHQTRQIMSAYKDEGRFLTYLAVLQQRMRWSDRILLPIGPHLFIVQSGDRRVTKCECGHDFGNYRDNWKLNALIHVRNDREALREIYPSNDIPDPAVDGNPRVHLPRLRHPARGRGLPARLPDPVRFRA